MSYEAKAVCNCANEQINVWGVFVFFFTSGTLTDKGIVNILHLVTSKFHDRLFSFTSPALTSF